MAGIRVAEIGIDRSMDYLPNFKEIFNPLDPPFQKGKLDPCNGVRGLGGQEGFINTQYQGWP